MRKVERERLEGKVASIPLILIEASFGSRILDYEKINERKRKDVIYFLTKKVSIGGRSPFVGNCFLSQNWKKLERKELV